MARQDERLAIFGTSGFAREVLPLVRHENGMADIVFVDDNQDLLGSRVAGVPVVSFDEAASAGRKFTIAIADQSVRRRLAKRCEDQGLAVFDVRANSFACYERVEVGEGLIACGNVIFTSDIKIGRHFHANIYSYVAHDCIIGDFVTFAPRVNCNGNVHIMDGAYIGTAAVLKQGRSGKPLVIGEGAVVGMGAVVTKDVAPGSVVVGNPAKVMDKSQ